MRGLRKLTAAGCGGGLDEGKRAVADDDLI
jgi:hypothetical protein